jgi:hypothetical protein
MEKNWVFSSPGLSSIPQIFTLTILVLALFFKFTKILVQKLGPISLYTLKTGEYRVTKFHNKFKMGIT